MAGAAVLAVGLSTFAERSAGPRRAAPPARDTAATPQRQPVEDLARAIPRPQGGSIAGGAVAGASYATGFEPGEGFAPGYIGGQQGWDAFVASAVEAHIDTAGPQNGAQHLRISRDPALGGNVNIGAFSPNLGTFVNTPGTLTVAVRINGGGARDYQVTPQSVTEGLVVTRVRLRRTGDIDVLDDNGIFVDTGFNWVPNVYRDVVVALGPATVQVSYGGQVVATYPDAFATAIQEVVLFGTNGLAAEHGDFDDFTITGGPIPTGACCNVDGKNGCAVLTGDECALIATAYYGGDGSLCGDCVTVLPQCNPDAGPCDQPHASGGCNVVECCALTCAQLPSCCFAEWTPDCVEASCLLCAPEPGCGVCGTGDCFEAHNAGEAFCDDTCGLEGACPGCCETVCAVDPFCCNNTWDGFCVDEAEALCGCQPADAPANDNCDNAAPIGLGVTAVSTVCATSDGPNHASCNDGFVNGLGADIWYSFNAGFTGALTVIPDPDDPATWVTQLALYEGCDCQALSDPPLACNVAEGDPVTASVTSGNCYTIRLGGSYLGQTGSGTLTVAAVPTACVGGSGDCLLSHGTPGCDVLDCCALVCLQSAACCNATWTQACADIAAGICGPLPCVLDTSGATVEENETCGLDTNGGCNSTPPVFTDIASGAVIHGVAWADGGTRDTDWYRLVVTASDDVDGDGTVDIHYDVVAELPVVSFAIVDPAPQCGGDQVAEGTTAYGQSCTSVSSGVATVAAPGTHYVFAGTGDAAGAAIFDGYPCPLGAGTFGNNYLLCVNVTDDGAPSTSSCVAAPCIGDCAQPPNGVVDTVDFLALLQAWGPGGAGTPCDFNGVGGIDTVDFLALLQNWGACP
jgi:hypothetical protein